MNCFFFQHMNGMNFPVFDHMNGMTYIILIILLFRTY